MKYIKILLCNEHAVFRQAVLYSVRYLPLETVRTASWQWINYAYLNPYQNAHW
jgi:hypothetical protein